MRSSFKRALTLALSFLLIFSTCTTVFASEYRNSIARTDTSTQAEVFKVGENDIVPGKILVKYKENISTGTKETLNAKFSAKSVVNFKKLNISKVELPVGKDVLEAVNEYNSDPNVEFAEPVYKRNAVNNITDYTKPQGVKSDIAASGVIISESIPNDEYYEEQWGLSVTDMVYTWDQVTSEQLSSIKVAVLDTGVDLDHPDLADSIISGYDFINNDATPDDDYGHGTHVAGIIAAKTDNNIGIAGVASGVKIMPIKVLDENGAGDTEYAIQGINWALENGADIINMSFGGETGSYAEYEAISAALDAGITIIAAAGNEGNTSPVSYPAAYYGVIGVGAVGYSDTDYFIADFSSTGEEIDVVAPGVGILSTYLYNNYGVGSGTSQAAPFVSGLAAILAAADSNLTNEEIENILEQSSIDLGDEGKDNYFGWGVIDPYNSITLPRLNMLSVYDEADPTDVDVILSTLDYVGTVVDSVYMSADLVLDRVSEINENDVVWTSVNSKSVEVVNGLGIDTILIPDAGIYELYISEDNVINPLGELIIKTPQEPVSNVASGTYSTSQTVTLTSQTEEASIYYTLNGSTPTTSSTLYTGPITIARTKTLKAIAVKNYTVSDISSYSYTIQTTSSPAPGGSGPVESSPSPSSTVNDTTSSPKSVVTESDGTKTAKIQPNESGLDLDSNNGKPAVIDAKTEEEVDRIEVNLTGSIFKKASDKQKVISIESNNVNFEILPGTIDITDSSANVQISAVQLSLDSLPDELKNKQQETNEVSLVFDFDLTVNDEKIKEFKKPITVTVKYDPSKVTDTDKIGVYYYNESKGTWEYVGGKVNSDGTITFTVEHFSKYTVMEYSKTFDDIKTHWAKDDIELMAAKHIAKGTDEDSFSPDTQITRAEFAALIARALNLEEMSNDDEFKDVDSDKWYSESISKVFAANIINGDDNKNFAPNENITREEMASVIARAYSYSSGENLDSIITTMEIRFTDEGTISNWARRNVIIASALGLINGNSDGAFAPKDNATRAQAISVIKRLMEKLGIL